MLPLFTYLMQLLCSHNEGTNLVSLTPLSLNITLKELTVGVLISHSGGNYPQALIEYLICGSANGLNLYFGCGFPNIELILTELVVT
jgi:hypothetical protein